MCGWVGHRRPKKCVASSSKGSSDSPTSFSGDGKRKMPQANPPCPRTTFARNKKFPPSKRVFGARAGCGDVTSLCKNLVKNRKTNFRRQAIQEPIFAVANADFEDDYDGRGCTCGTFLVICAQPSHVQLTSWPSANGLPCHCNGRQLINSPASVTWNPAPQAINFPP
jgi:hypothetical protein